jgi:enediyne biosynthesis protein E4
MKTDFSSAFSATPLRFASRRSHFVCLLVAGVVCGLVIGATVGYAQPDTAKTLKLLEKRKEQQTEAAKQFKAFYGFKFTDRHQESGIRFENHVVDDAGRNYKPAHYDHGTGLAVADVDGDGLLDVYFVDQLGQCQLWRNLGHGKFADITKSAGVGMEGKVCAGASFADVDNDGLSDLFVATVRMGNVLFHNLGKGRFKNVTKEAGLDYVGHSSTGVFFDFNQDGLLDLFLVNVGVYTSDQRGSDSAYVALTDAFLGHLLPERTERSILYKNLGELKFKNVSQEMNLQDEGWSGDASFCDLNEDGWPDLYVLNMQGNNHYYENQKGKGFVEKTRNYFPKTPWGAMGIKFFDFNQDGLMDLFVTDMHSDMTVPQTTAALDLGLGIEKSKSEQWCGPEWRSSILSGLTNDSSIFGNAFYRNEGNGVFREVSDALGVETYWPWGMSVGDLNADGFEDVFITAGMGYPYRYAINSVLLNEGGRRFFDSEFLLGVVPQTAKDLEIDFFTLDCDQADKDNPLCDGKSGKVKIPGTVSSRSSAIFDVDDDGDLDIVVNDFNHRPQVLLSNLSEKKRTHFLKVKLTGTSSNRDGLGARVKVRAGGKTYTQYSDGKSGYLSHSVIPLYFGLGEADKAERVEVRWPSGKSQVLTNMIPINGLLRITESSK